MNVKSLELGAALEALAPPGVCINHRVIGMHDHLALLPCERKAFAKNVLKVAQQSGAARTAARQLLSSFGQGDIAIPRSPSGAPCWPAGIVGSLAHDDCIALATIARDCHYSALGIDIEPAIPLPPGLISFVATPAERGMYSNYLLESRLFFVIKEGVFKALYPLDGLFLDFQDIQIDLNTKMASTTFGQCIRFTFTMSPRIVALTFRSLNSS